MGPLQLSDSGIRDVTGPADDPAENRNWLGGFSAGRRRIGSEEALDSVDHLVRFSFEAGASDSGHLDARELQLLVAETIALEGGAGAMGLIGVEFNREALLGPVDVELKAADVEAGGWSRQAGFVDEFEKPSLDPGSVEGSGLIENEGPTQRPESVVSLVALEH
ncbi:MAG: hypothetical protein WBL45_04630 [Solirubrobacterales bacterium]